MYISKKADDEPAGCEGCRHGAVIEDEEFALGLFHCICPEYADLHQAANPTCHLLTREFWDERESGEPCDYYEFEDRA